MRESQFDEINIVSSDLQPKIPEVYSITDEQRSHNNIMRHSYRPLTDIDKITMQDVKDMGLVFHNYLSAMGESRELAFAKARIEEAVMWATKHVTR